MGNNPSFFCSLTPRHAAGNALAADSLAPSGLKGYRRFSAIAKAGILPERGTHDDH
jgi:hypothetical protein